MVAVEPHPLCMRWLRRKFRHCRRVQLIERAVGAKAGGETLLVSRLHPTVSTISEGWRESVRQAVGFSRVRWQDHVPVEVTTLDELLTVHGQPAFCKIDVEGAELEALNGTCRPLPALSFEYIPAAIDLAHACVERLETLGSYEYNWNVGEPPRLVARRWVGPDRIRRQLSLLAESSDSGDVYARLVTAAASFWRLASRPPQR